MFKLEFTQNELNMIMNVLDAAPIQGRNARAVAAAIEQKIADVVKTEVKTDVKQP